MIKKLKQNVFKSLICFSVCPKIVWLILFPVFVNHKFEKKGEKPVTIDSWTDRNYFQVTSGLKSFWY